MTCQTRATGHACLRLRSEQEEDGRGTQATRASGLSRKNGATPSLNRILREGWLSVKKEDIEVTRSASQRSMPAVGMPA